MFFTQNRKKKIFEKAVLIKKCLETITNDSEVLCDNKSRKRTFVEEKKDNLGAILGLILNFKTDRA